MLNTKKIVAFVPTTDYDRARAFFEGTLGLRFVSLDHFALVLDANGIMLRVTKAQFVPNPFTILGWQVDDIDADVRDLTARGVQFERYGFLEQDALGVWTAPSGDKVAWFKDPDGNTLSLSQHVTD
jgi:catechol 2,3-dioxygenase-like lactoylglutathione lyase family enzyme